MAHGVTAAGQDIAPPPRSVTETEFFIIQQVRRFKALHAAFPLFGRRIAGLVGLKWDAALQQILDDLVERQWMTYTPTIGYAVNVWSAQRDDAAAHADTGAFALQ
jgi:hypothetical protein